MKILAVITLICSILALTACQTVQKLGSGASDKANELADKVIYKPIDYENADQKGPKLVVLPGKIKSNNATFKQKMTDNSIADFGELELSRANFGVLERSDLGPLLDEIRLAVNLGEPRRVRRLKRGKFRTTKWFVTFDILKAEPVASAKTGFDGQVLGSLISSLAGSSSTGLMAGLATSSIKTAEAAGVWIVGLRYKVVNANTTEQVTTGYYEEKMEIGSKNTSILGFSQGQTGGLTLDNMIQILVQKAVADLDRQKGPIKLSRNEIRKLQTILNEQGFKIGRPDGYVGRRTRQALSKFQTEQSLAVTGKFDLSTVRKLRGIVK